MNRRDLMKYAGAAGVFGLLASKANLFAAPSGQKKRLVMVMAQGGWDTTYCLDPKTQSAKVDVPSETGEGITRFGADLDIQTGPTRPGVTGFFTKYASQAAVIRGISVGSVAHQECVKRMATGTRNETNPDLCAIVAHGNGNDLPLPYLILGDTAFAGEYAVSAGRVGATNQILALLDPAQAYDTAGKKPYATSAAEDAILSKYAGATRDRVQATRGSLGYNKRRVDDFVQSIERGKKLVAAKGGFGARGRTLAIANQVDLALDALEQDVSHAVMLNTRLGWDTHDTITDQSGFYETTFSALTTLMDQMTTRPGRTAGSKMIDDTVILCFSEFSRTPKLNENNGKDHWPITSAMVIGAGVKGGRAFGATTNAVETTPVDFATGAKSATGKVLTSSNFAAGVLSLCGVDPAGRIDGEVFDAFIR